MKEGEIVIYHLKIKRFFISLFTSFCLLVSSSFPYLSFAANKTDKPLIIRAKETSKTEFSAYIKTESVKTYSQHQLDIIRKTKRPIRLHEELKQAQMEFLSHEPKDSLKTFQKISEQLHTFDWNTEERKIIFYSLMRLAQLEKNKQKQKLLTQEAFVFGMGLKLDLQVFPPPLVKLYSEIKNTANFVNINLKKLFPMHEIILINGKVFLNNKKIKLPYGSYRINALSSSHKSWTKTLSLSRLISKKIQTPSFVSGNCKDAALKNKALDRRQIQVLFPNFCVWNSQLPLVKVKTPVAPIEMPTDNQSLKEISKKPKTHWWQEEWFWLGVAVVLGTTGSILILDGGEPNSQTQKQQQKEAPKAKIKIGF